MANVVAAAVGHHFLVVTELEGIMAALRERQEREQFQRAVLNASCIYPEAHNANEWIWQLVYTDAPRYYIFFNKIKDEIDIDKKQRGEIAVRLSRQHILIIPSWLEGDRDGSHVPISAPCLHEAFRETP